MWREENEKVSREALIVRTPSAEKVSNYPTNGVADDLMLKNSKVR